MPPTAWKKYNLDHLRCVFCLLKDGTARDDLTGRGAIRQKDAQSPVYSIHKISSADKHLPIFFSPWREKRPITKDSFLYCVNVRLYMYIQTAGSGRSVVLGPVTNFALI